MALSSVCQGLFSCLIGARKGSFDLEPSLEVKPREEARQGGRYQTVCNYSKNLCIGSHDGDSKGTYQPAVDMGACKSFPAAANPSANAGDADIIATRLHDSCAVNYGEDCSLDSLICASIPSALTVFTVSGAPIHQNPTSVLHFGNRIRLQRSGSDEAGNSDDKFLMEIFEYEPEKLERLLYEILREGGGQWKGVIRIPARLLVTEHVAQGSACHSPMPGQASHVSKQLPNATLTETASPAVSTPPVGPQPLLARHPQRRRSQPAAAVDFEDADYDDSDIDSYPELLLERLAQGPGIEWAKSKAYSANATLGRHVGNVMWPDTLGLRPGGCLRPSLNLRARPGVNAARPADRASFDKHEVGRWRLATGRSRLSLAGDMAGGMATAVAFSRSATPSMYCSLPSSLHVRQYTGAALRGPKAGSLASGGGGGVTGADVDGEEASEQRPSYSRCSNTLPTRDCLLSPTSIHSTAAAMTASNDNLSAVGVNPFAFSPGAASSPLAHNSSYRLAHGGQTGHTGRLAMILQRPNCRSASFSHTLASDTLDIFTGADASSRQGSLRTHSHAHSYGHGVSPKPVCALGFELGDIPESVAANAFGHRSMGWESGGNPLATSTFGLALGGPLDGLPIAATPLSALATVMSNNNRRSRSGGVGATDQIPYLPPRSSLDTYLGMGPGFLGSSPVSAGLAPSRRPASASMGITCTERFRLQATTAATASATTAATASATTAARAATISTANGTSVMAAGAAAQSGVLGGAQESVVVHAAANSTTAPAAGCTIGILRRTTSAAAVAHVWQHAASVRQNSLRQQSTTTGAGNLSRVLTFASSLKNAPAATQMLAEGSRQGSFGSRTYRSRTCVGVDVAAVGAASTAPVVPAPKTAARQRQWESADETQAVQRVIAEQMAGAGDVHEAIRLPYIAYNDFSVNAAGTDSVRGEVVVDGEQVDPEVCGSTRPNHGAMLLLSSSWLAAGAEPFGGGDGALGGGGGGGGHISCSGEIRSLPCGVKETATTNSANTTADNNRPSHRVVMNTDPSNATFIGDPSNAMPPFSWATTTGAVARPEVEQLSISSASTGLGSGTGPATAATPLRSAASSPFLRPRAQQAVGGSACTGSLACGATSTAISTAASTGTNRPSTVHRLGRGAMTGGYTSVASTNIPGPHTDTGVQQESGQQVLGHECQGDPPSVAPAHMDSSLPAFTGLPSATGSTPITASGMGAAQTNYCSRSNMVREAPTMCRNSGREGALQGNGRCCEQCAQSHAIAEGGEEEQEYQTVRFLARMASAKCKEQRHEEQRRYKERREQVDCEQEDPVAQAVAAEAAAPAASAAAAGPSRVPSGADGGVPKRGRMEYWHEVWATRAVDPVTKQDVIVIAQHDVSAKVIAERHLALVMEAEHRLLEQLFPKHILTHVTEEWIAEAERVAAGGAAGVPGLTRNNSPSSAVRCSRLRPVVRDCNALATWHPEVTLLFADIKGFTPMCKQVPPRTVMTMLNDLYSRFDAMLDRYGVFKVETIGDCYFVAGGLVHEDEDGMSAVTDGRSTRDPLHAQKVFMFAKAMLSAAREVKLPTTGEPVQIRVGISSGSVVSGVVGTRMPRFCLFGDTVNTTSRMESTGFPGAIHASASAQALLRSEAWKPTGGIEVKGKGLMQTFLWRPLVNEDGAELQWPTCATEAAVAAATATERSTLINTTTGTQSSGGDNLDGSSATLARQPTTPACLEVPKEEDFRGDNRNNGTTDKLSSALRRGGDERIENNEFKLGRITHVSE